jgi:protocatechuate 3,4-dioxygenase beta subunit
MYKKLIISAISISLVISFVSIFIFVGQADTQIQDGVIYGKILDKDSGHSVPDAIVRVEKNNEEIATFFSDEKGNYTISDLDNGEYVLKIFPPPGYEMEANKVVLIENAETQRVNFTLIPHYDYYISGNVYLNNGKTPLGGAKVQAYSTKDYMPYGSVATTQKDGSYTIKGLKPSEYNLSCSSNKAHFPIQKNIILSKKKTSRINFIAYDNSIYGMIKDEKGNPVKDAVVSLQYIPNTNNTQDHASFMIRLMEQPSRVIDVDDKGEYRILSIVPGKYNIEIYSIKLKRKISDNIIIEQNTHDNINFVLGKSEEVSSIYGRVIASGSGKALPNVAIALVDSNNQAASKRFETNNQGMFTISGLSEGIYYLSAKKDGLATMTKKIQVEGGGKKINVILAMNMPGSISGTVYCIDKKTPAGNVKIFANNDNSLGVATTDSNGYYKIDNLEEGVYDVKAISSDARVGYEKNVRVIKGKNTSNVLLYLSK